MARSAASYQAPPRASNSLKATNIANELLNASYNRVRTFHPVLELDLPEIVMEGCGSESPDCKIVKNYKWLHARRLPSCRVLRRATSLGKLALVQGPTERQGETSRKLRATSISRFCQGGGDPTNFKDKLKVAASHTWGARGARVA
jgi:hypothetical protein